MKHILHLVVALLIGITVNAQVSTPYSSGFDNASEKAGWHEIRIGSTEYFGFTYADAQAATPPTALHHDYPVDNMDGDTVEDWFISPQLILTGNNTLAFQYYIYSITGSETPVDYFGVWFSPDSDDPTSGDYIELVDLTSTTSSSFDWRDTFGIVIPSSATMGYIAFRYRATNNWFVANADSIVVDGISGIASPTSANLRVFPSLATDHITLESTETIRDIALVDALGRTSEAMLQDNRLHVSQLTPGVYTVVANSVNGKRAIARFVRQ